MIQNFAVKWLNLDDLSDVDPDPRLFPEFNDALMGDFSEETRRFLTGVLLENRPVTELLTADYTYVNERLARHYGIDGVYGAQFRRVALDDARRFGLLGKGSVMMRTSYGDRTSIVLRGNWVLEKLLGSPHAATTAGCGNRPHAQAGREANHRARAIWKRHRANPSCNQCHGVIDLIGLALENFSVTGKWRDRDAQANAVIDPTAILPGGIPVDGPVALRAQLMQHPEKFVRTVYREDDDVRSRTRTGIFRHAAGPRDRRGRGSKRLPSVRPRHGPGQQRCVQVLGTGSGSFQRRCSSGFTGLITGRRKPAGERKCSSPKNICHAERSSGAPARPSRCRCSTQCCPLRQHSLKPPRRRRCAWASSTFRTAP